MKNFIDLWLPSRKLLDNKDEFILSDYKKDCQDDGFLKLPAATQKKVKVRSYLKYVAHCSIIVWQKGIPIRKWRARFFWGFANFLVRQMKFSASAGFRISWNLQSLSSFKQLLFSSFHRGDQRKKNQTPVIPAKNQALHFLIGVPFLDCDLLCDLLLFVKIVDSRIVKTCDELDLCQH